MYRIVRSSLLLSAAVTLLGACAGPSGGRGGPPPGAGGGSGEMRAACKTLVEQNREQFTETARLLALTPKQQVLWENYQASVDVLIGEQMRLDGVKGARRSALLQIDGKIDAARQRVVLMQQVAAQAAILYQSLDDAQKRVADRHLASTVPDLNAGSGCPPASSGTGPSGPPAGGAGRP